MTTARDGFRAVVRDDPGDLATPCLLLAHALSDDPDSPPDATVAAGHAALDALAAQVSGHDHAALLAVLGRMAGRPGDHRRLEASLLPDVLRTGHGLPILLSIVWLEVARRSGIAACGLGVPGRFLIAVGASHEQSVAADVIAGLCTLADPFDGGSTLRIDQVQEFARQAG
ncbi:MAG TPA: transglutaminase family protein, partial [Candidatus Eisenbacteria bacterium]|nr:transglutaminase family protein [Candidatus Eisenbacteria bacterium]